MLSVAVEGHATGFFDDSFGSGQREGGSPEWRCIKQVFGSVNDVGFLEICGEA